MNIISRLQNKYFIYHSIGSIALIVAIYFVLSKLWYPEVFFDLAGGIDGFKILLAVDLILGPTLTFLFFTSKQSPPFKDLAAIFAVQAACLLTGLFLIYEQRPLALVFVDNNAYTVNTGSFKANNTQPPDLSNIPGSQPKTIAIISPQDDKEKKAFYRSQLEEGPLQVRTNLYTPIKKALPTLKEIGLPIEYLDQMAKERNITFMNSVAPTTLANPNARAFRLFTGHRRSYIIIDAESGTIIDSLTYNTTKPISTSEN